MIPDTNYDILIDPNLRSQVKAVLYGLQPPDGINYDTAFANRSDIPEQFVIWDNVEIIPEARWVHATGTASFINPDENPRTIYGCFLYVEDDESSTLIQSEPCNPITIDGTNNTVTIPIDMWYGGALDGISGI